MSIAPNSLTFSATMTGSVNHEALSLTGQGQIDPSLGLAEGRYTFRTLPKSFDPNLLTAFLITGYPDAAASIGNVANLFRDHSYGYRRTVTFREGGELRFRASCMLKGGHITSKLHLVGKSRFRSSPRRSRSSSHGNPTVPAACSGISRYPGAATTAASSPPMRIRTIRSTTKTRRKMEFCTASFKCAARWTVIRCTKCKPPVSLASCPRACGFPTTRSGK